MAKKNKNTAAVVVSSYSPVLSVTQDADSNNLTWTFGTVPTGNIIKWTAVFRRYTNPSGQTLTYFGEPWQVAKNLYQEQHYIANGVYVTAHDEIALVPFDTQDLPTGTYEYELRGTYGPSGTSLHDKPYYSNRVTIVVS